MKKPVHDPRGEWQYECTSCGDTVDVDHDYCVDCDQRGGEWVLVDNDGEIIPLEVN
jgi:uncharacterized OB-fold protein